MKSKAAKQAEASERQSRYESMTPDAKLENIRARRGESRRECARIMRSL